MRVKIEKRVKTLDDVKKAEASGIKGNYVMSRAEYNKLTAEELNEFHSLKVTIHFVTEKEANEHKRQGG